MPDTRLTLTDRSIGGLPFAVSSQYFARDTELAGFAVLVGKRRKTFVVQGDIRNGKQRLPIRSSALRPELFVRGRRAKARCICGLTWHTSPCHLGRLCDFLAKNDSISSQTPLSFIADKALACSNHRASRSLASGQVSSCRLTIIGNTRTSHGTVTPFASRPFS